MTTYTKLQSGDWGLRSDEPLTTGAKTTVQKRSGERKPETVGEQVWAGKGVYLYTIRASSGYSSGYRSSQSGCSQCRRTSTRRAQIWEDCPSCGTEPIYV